MTPELLVEMYRRNDKTTFCILLKVYFNIKNDVAEIIYKSFLLLDSLNRMEAK